MRQRFAEGLVRAEVSGLGKGAPTVWLLHSLLADAGSCMPLAGALAGTHRVVLPDLPGFGGSPPAGDLVGAADRIGAALIEDGIEDGIEGGTVTVLGNGYGSFVAMLAALRHPGPVSRLVLVGTGARFNEPGRAAFRTMAAGAAAKGLEGISDVAMRRLFSPAFQAANPAFVEERRERFLATDPAVFVQACNDLAGLDLSGAIGGLEVPTLIVVGDGDEATPPAMARELAAMVPGAQFKELAGLAHVPQLQDVARFHAAIAAFVAQR